MKRIIHADGKKRCVWCGADPVYVAYHDHEWGVPEYDDRALFEKLILDGFQAGLSWITILRKRDNFRRAFDKFNPEKIARYDARKLASLMKDIGLFFKYKPYAVKASHPLGYSIFLQRPLEGFSFQNHLEHKTEVFHILEVMPGGFVFLCKYEDWQKHYEPHRL